MDINFGDKNNLLRNAITHSADELCKAFWSGLPQVVYSHTLKVYTVSAYGKSYLTHTATNDSAILSFLYCDKKSKVFLEIKKRLIDWLKVITIALQTNWSSCCFVQPNSRFYIGLQGCFTVKQKSGKKLLLFVKQTSFVFFWNQDIFWYYCKLSIISQIVSVE